MKKRETKMAKALDGIGWVLATAAIGLAKAADWYDVAAPVAGRAVRRKGMFLWWDACDLVDDVEIWAVNEAYPRLLAFWWDAKGVASTIGQALTKVGKGALAKGLEAKAALSSGWEWRKELYTEIEMGRV